MFETRKQIEAGVLDVGYVDAGPTHGQPVVLLHGWPYDIYSYADVVPAVAAEGYRAIVPYLRGYGTTRFLSDNTPGTSFYFATERGRAGYAANRREFAKLIWNTASPRWAFDDATFERSAAAFDTPDHVDVVIDNYRWRLGLSPGEPQCDELEGRLAQAPTISVPTITLEGDANGAPHPDASAYAQKFSGKYTHHVISGGIGHNLPQEAPDAFADAIFQADAFAS